MDVASVFEAVPFVDHLGIEFREAADGHAEAYLELRPALSSNPVNPIAHGGVTYSLADTVGGAAVISRYERICPTIDMRIDYLAPATDDVYAEADVTSEGETVAVADVEVYNSEREDERVATARGVYKVAGQGDATPWTDGVDRDGLS